MVVSRPGNSAPSRRHRDRRVARRLARNSTTALLFHPVGGDALAVRGRAGFLRLSMGLAPDRNGVSCDLPRPVAPFAECDSRRASATGPLRRGGAAVQVDVLLRRREAHERRCQLAETTRARFPFPHATPAKSSGVVRPPTPSRDSHHSLRLDVLHRTPPAIRLFPPEKSPPDCRLVCPRVAGGNRPHRQLRIL